MPSLFPGLQFPYEVREAILRLQGNEHLVEEQGESRLSLPSVGFWVSVALKVQQRKHLADDAFRRGQSKGAHRATRKAKAAGRPRSRDILLHRLEIIARSSHWLV